MTLQDDQALEQSDVVANCCMNRERTLTGKDGYNKTLGFDIVQFLLDRPNSKPAAWLDLCCGAGVALREAARAIDAIGESEQPRIVGVDLVGQWNATNQRESSLHLIQASLSDWTPGERFDLITCVHGLHYIGDKLKLIANAAEWLQEDGLFAANLDLDNFCVKNHESGAGVVAATLRKQGLQYDKRRKLLSCKGSRALNMTLVYLGADDKAGPNYTLQPAVNSHYEQKA